MTYGEILRIRSNSFLPGKLGLPTVKLESKFRHDFSVKLFNEYFDCVIKTKLGQEVFAVLEIDPRVLRLKNQIMSCGSGFGSFEVTNLAKWFLWHANNVGIEQANVDLETFLNSDELTVINSLWVTGIEVDEEFEIENGIYIRPAHTMPDCREKEQFSQHDFHTIGWTELKPTCVITKNVRIPKIYDSLKGHIFSTSSSRFSDCALLLNVLLGVTCLPKYATGHWEASTPLGLFGGSVGGSSIYDIPARMTTKITFDTIKQLRELLTCFDKLNEKSKIRIQTAIHRLSQAKRRIQPADQILDLGIALEMLLLDSKPEQLALSFRLRGSWLLGKTQEERLKDYQTLKEIYTYRSDVAHTGVLCDGNATKIAKVIESLPKYQKIAEDIFRKIILKGFPKWDELILNIQNQPLSQVDVIS